MPAPRRRSTSKVAISGIKSAPGPASKPAPPTSQPASRPGAAAPKRALMGFARPLGVAAPRMGGVPAAKVGGVVQSFIDDGASHVEVTAEGGGTFSIQPS